MNGSLTAAQRRALAALCDTYVPASSPREGADAAYWRRTATDLGVDGTMAGFLETRVPAEELAGLRELLDALDRLGLARLPAGVRPFVLSGLGRVSPDARRGLDALRALTLMLFHALPGANGVNPNWATIGYGGPPPVPPRPADDAVRPWAPQGEEATLAADVCVVGSGAGGGVIAGELARAGLRVVVLEAGGHHRDADFVPHELAAYERLYWRGGYQATRDGTIQVIAGAALGGGTVVNWTNCVRLPERIRHEWARAHGLEGVDTPEFDAHQDAVLERISGTDALSDLNGPNARMWEGAERLGYSVRRAVRNAAAEGYDPATAGHMGYGDRSGSKQSTLKTYLQDAARNGAVIVARCRADRVLVEGARAAGVEATYRHGGRRCRVTVRAPRVVVACGALETPALLLRSGIGGQAAGNYLRLHPCVAMVGSYRDRQDPWWGPPQSAVVDEFAEQRAGHGFLVECVHFGIGVAASTIPWHDGVDHKRWMSRAAHAASFIGLVRDRGHGRVGVDQRGEAVLSYPLSDELDLHHLSRALETLASIHEAAGAQEILELSPERPAWRRGEPLDRFVRRVQSLPFGPGRRPVFSAHQMGSARMGTDPRTSVADPWGELHDARGVWIGDTSAFPTAPGVNPMLPCMALARRTARAILEQSGLAIVPPQPVGG